MSRQDELASNGSTSDGICEFVESEEEESLDQTLMSNDDANSAVDIIITKESGEIEKPDYTSLRKRIKTTAHKKFFDKLKKIKENHSDSSLKDDASVSSLVFSDFSKDDKTKNTQSKFSKKFSKFVKPYEVKFYLVCGTDIYNRDYNKTSTNSYIKIKQFIKTITSSKTVNNNINPVWLQLSQIRLKTIEIPIDFIVYEADSIKSRKIGQATLDLRGYDTDKTYEITLKLGQLNEFGHFNEERSNGSLLVKFQITQNQSSKSDEFSELSDSISPMLRMNSGTKILLAGNKAQNNRFKYFLSTSDDLKPSENRNEICLSEKLNWNMEHWTLASFYSRSEYKQFVFNCGHLLVTIIRAENVVLESHKKGASGIWDMQGENEIVAISSLNDLPNPFVKIQVGNFKKTTKTIQETKNPVWNAHFDVKITQDTDPMMNFTLFHDSGSSPINVGVATVDISKLPFDLTRMFKIPLANMTKFKTNLLVLLTLTGLSDYAMMKSSIRMNPSEFDPERPILPVGYQEFDLNSEEFQKEEGEQIRRISEDYKIFRTLAVINDIGWLNVQIFRSKFFPNGEFFATVRLPNLIVRTKNMKSNSSIEWNKSFILPVKDIHSVIILSVYELKDDPELYGQLHIPLLKVNPGKKQFLLKLDKEKDALNSTISLKINLTYNILRAIRMTFQPKEEDYLNQEKRFQLAKVEQYFHVIKKNGNRVFRFYDMVIDLGRFQDDLISWERPMYTLSGLCIYQYFVWFGQPYMIPLLLLLYIWLYRSFRGFKTIFDKRDLDDMKDDEMLEETNDSKKFMLSSFYKSFQKYTFKLQDGLDKVASFFERIFAIFSWQVPWLTTIFSVLLVLATIVLYIFPFRWVASAYGLKKFLKRLFRKKSGKSGTVMNFISRYPNQIELEEQEIEKKKNKSGAMKK